MSKTNRVDVLSVIDAAIARAAEDARQYRYDTDKDGDELRAARAAVAELVAAEREVNAATDAYIKAIGRNPQDEKLALGRALLARDRRIAALAAFEVTP